ncbi:MAG: hypothetical protein DMG26_21030, partial [Acidobacteria bacterium]
MARSLPTTLTITGRAYQKEQAEMKKEGMDNSGRRSFLKKASLALAGIGLGPRAAAGRRGPSPREGPPAPDRAASPPASPPFKLGLVTYEL